MGIRIDKYHRPDMYTSDAMEQYAQAKVLEALEREVPKAYISGSEPSFADLQKYGREYYETEVKPKYEN